MSHIPGSIGESHFWGPKKVYTVYTVYTQFTRACPPMMSKMIEPTPLYETDLSDDENAESMMKMFIHLLTEVITQ